MMSMLAHLQATAPQRPLRFVHAARHAGVQAFAPQVRELTRKMANAQAWFVHETAQPELASAQPDALGRLDLQHLADFDVLPPDADHYLCGPRGFMASQIQALKGRGVAAERIHAEAFGTGGVAS